MKTTFALLTALACPLMAQEPAPAPAPAPESTPNAAKAPSADAVMYAGLIQQVLSCVDELTEVTAGIKDKETADAAAPRVQMLAMRGMGIFLQLQGMPKLTPEVQQEVETLVGDQAAERMQTVLPKLFGSLMPLIANGNYGSTALTDSIAPMLQNMMGGGMMGRPGMQPGKRPAAPQPKAPEAPAPVAPAQGE